MALAVFIVADNYQIGAKLSFYSDVMIPVTHIHGRQSHYTLLNLQKEIARDEEICFISAQKTTEAFKIDTNYHQAMYVFSKTTLDKIATRYGTTYEKIIRN